MCLITSLPCALTLAVATDLKKDGSIQNHTSGLPFRITPNILRLVGSAGRAGIVPAVMASLAQCLSRKSVCLLPVSVRIRLLTSTRQTSVVHVLRQAMYDELAEFNARHQRQAPWTEAAVRQRACELSDQVLEVARGYAVPESAAEGVALESRLNEHLKSSSDLEMLCNLGPHLQPWM